MTSPDGEAFIKAPIPRDSWISVSGALISVNRIGIKETESKIEAKRNN